MPYLSCWPPLFVPPKETVYAPHLSLLWAHLLHFLSTPSYCLLSLSILPINYSAQPLPPTEAMSPPPLEMNDWQVCSVSNIHANNRGEGKWLRFTEKKQEMTECEKTEEGWKKLHLTCDNQWFALGSQTFLFHFYQLWHLINRCSLPLCRYISPTCRSTFVSNFEHYTFQ